MILICYDGSEDSKAAIARGVELFKEQPAAVLTVWQPFVEVITHAYGGFGIAAGMLDQEAIDERARESAEERAREGAELARDAGLDAEPRSCPQLTTTAEAILNQADAVEADAIVMGSRGLTGLKSVLLGSVSDGVLHQADRPVIVVPSPDVAAARAARRVSRRD